MLRCTRGYCIREMMLLLLVAAIVWGMGHNVWAAYDVPQPEFNISGAKTILLSEMSDNSPNIHNIWAVYSDSTVIPGVESSIPFKTIAAAKSPDDNLYIAIAPDAFEAINAWNCLLWKVRLSDGMVSPAVSGVQIHVPEDEKFSILQFDSAGNLCFLGSPFDLDEDVRLYRRSALTGDAIPVSIEDLQVNTFSILDNDSIFYKGINTDTGNIELWYYDHGINTPVEPAANYEARPDSFRAVYWPDTEAYKFWRLNADGEAREVSVKTGYEGIADEIIIGNKGEVYGLYYTGDQVSLQSILPYKKSASAYFDNIDESCLPLLIDGNFWYIAQMPDGRKIRMKNLESGKETTLLSDQDINIFMWEHTGKQLCFTGKDLKDSRLVYGKIDLTKVRDNQDSNQWTDLTFLSGQDIDSIAALEDLTSETLEINTDISPQAKINMSSDRNDTLCIEFTSEMNKASVEAGLLLTLNNIPVPVCMAWFENTLYLLPDWDSDELKYQSGLELKLSIEGAFDIYDRELLNFSGNSGLSEMIHMSPYKAVYSSLARKSSRSTITTATEAAWELLGLSELTLGDFIPEQGGYKQALNGGSIVISAFQTDNEAWHMGVTLAQNPSSFPLSTLYTQLQSILGGAELTQLTLIASEGEGNIEPANLPDSVKTYLSDFAEDDQLSMRSGVNFFGKISINQGILGEASKLILGDKISTNEIQISGVVGYDFIKQLFESQNIESSAPPADPEPDADPVTQIALTVQLPAITPVPFNSINNKDVFHVEFSGTSFSIEYQNNGFELSASRTLSLWALGNNWLNSSKEPLEITNTLGIAYEDNSLTTIKSGGSVGVNWENAFGLAGLTIKSLNLDTEINPLEKVPEAGFVLGAEVNLGDAPENAAAEFAFNIQGSTISEISFTVSAIDLGLVPGIKDIPGINEFSIDEVSIGYAPGTQDVYLSGQTTWTTRDNLQAAAAIMKEGDAFVLLFRLLDFSLAKIIPDVPEPFKSLELPAGIIGISTDSLENLTLGDLPEKIQELFEGIKEQTEDELPIYDGVTLAAALDLEKLPAGLETAVKELGITKTGLEGMGLEGPLVLAGSLGGIFSGTVKFGLYADLPRVTLPDALRDGPLGKLVSFNNVKGKLFMRADVVSTAMHFGLSGDLNLDLPRLIPDDSVEGGDKDNLTFGGELYVDVNAVGVGVKVAGKIEGTLNDFLGLTNFAISNPAIMGGVDADGAVEVGIGGDMSFKTSENEILEYGTTLMLNVNVASSVPIPKKLAVLFNGTKMGAIAQMEIADVLLKAVTTGPMSQEVIKLIPDQTAQNAFKQLQTDLKSTSLKKIFMTDQLPLPLLELSDVDFYFATPGAVIPGRDELDGMGIKVAGAMSIEIMGQKQLIGKIDDVLSLKEGLKISGELGDFDLGPVALTNAKLDIGAGIPGIHGNVPRFIISGDSKILFYEGKTDVELSLEKAHFLIKGDWGAFGSTELKADSVGENLLAAKDFTMSLASSSNIYKGLREEVGKGIDDFLNGTGSQYTAALKNLQNLKGSLNNYEYQVTQIRSEAFTRKNNTINSYYRNIAGDQGAVNYYRWRISQLPWWNWWDRAAFNGAIIWHNGQIWRWRAGINLAEKNYQWEISELHPKIIWVRTQQTAVRSYITVAENLLTTLQNINNEIKHIARKLIDEATKNEIFVLNNASMNFSLADAIANPNNENNLNLDMTFLEKYQIKKTIKFNVLHPVNIFGFIKDEVIKILTNTKNSRTARSLSVSESDYYAFIGDYAQPDLSTRKKILRARLYLSEDDKARVIKGYANQNAREGGEINTPENDDFANAVLLEGEQGQVSASSVNATIEFDEPDHAWGFGEASLWWKWTAPSDGGACFNTHGSNFDTLLAVYTGSEQADLQTVVYNDQDIELDDNTSKVSFPIIAGTTYWIAVDGYEGDFGDVFLNYSLCQVIRQDNEGQENAALIQDLAETIQAANQGALEPVWWKFSVNTEGWYDCSTYGSSFDTVLAVYTENQDGSLELTAENDEYSSYKDGTSYIKFYAQPETTYFISIDGYEGAKGSIVLNCGQSGPPVLPDNDNFTNAAVLEGSSGQITSSNTDATSAPGEPDYDPEFPGASVWWKWTAEESGWMTFDTSGSDFDTMMAVCTQTENGIQPIAMNDDDGENPESRIILKTESGVEYYIVIDGYEGEQGNIVLNYNTYTPPSAPVNDNFSARIILNNGSGKAEVSTVGAGIETGEPEHAGIISTASVWYSWTAPYTGGVKFDTSGSDFDTILAVYTGNDFQNLKSLSSNDDMDEENLTSCVIFKAHEGQSYIIAVDGCDGDRGNAVLNYAPYEMAPPENDDFNNRKLISGTETSITGNNKDASKEINEPDHAGMPGGTSVWYAWTAPETGKIALDTKGSPIDTMLAVYTGDTLTELNEIISNDEVAERFDGSSRVIFSAEKGRTYHIAVDGWQSEQGDIALSISPYEADPPKNDSFAESTLLTGNTGTLNTSNLDAGSEIGEPNYTGAYEIHSIWFKWTASETKGMAFSTSGSSIDTVLAVYTGTSIENLNMLAFNDQNSEAADGSSMVVFEADAGTDYYIAIDGFSGMQGDITLAYEPVSISLPENDDFANRILLTQETGSIEGTNTDSGFEPGELFDNKNPGTTSVWYSWTAQETGGMTFETSGIDTILSVYTGGYLESLVPVVSNNNAQIDDGTSLESGASQVIFRAEQGITYNIAVSGNDSSQGDFTLKYAPFEYGTAPENDNFTNRIEIPAGTSTIEGSNIFATHEQEEPQHTGKIGQGSIWYSWTATQNGSLNVNTQGSNFDTLLAVYTGFGLNGLVSIAADDDAYTDGSSNLIFEVTAGTVYIIAVDGGNGTWGDMKLNLNFTEAPAEEPVSDDDTGTVTDYIDVDIDSDNSDSNTSADETDENTDVDDDPNTGSDADNTETDTNTGSDTDETDENTDVDEDSNTGSDADNTETDTNTGSDTDETDENTDVDEDPNTGSDADDVDTSIGIESNADDDVDKVTEEVKEETDSNDDGGICFISSCCKSGDIGFNYLIIFLILLAIVIRKKKV